MPLKIEDYEFEDESPLNPADYEIEDTPSGLPSINEPTTVTPPTQPGGIQIPDSVKSAAQLAYTPVRGTRGIGVGIQKLFAGVNPAKLMLLPQLLGPEDMATIAQNADDALQSSAAAMQPGYVPQEGEKAGAFIGEAAGAAGLTAPIAAMGATPLAAAGVNAAVGGGLTALQQASEQGAVSPGSVALNAGLGAAIPLIKPIYQGIKGAAMKLLPEVLAKTQNSPVKATKILLDDPKVMEAYAGTEEAIRQQVDEVTGTLNQIRDEAGTALRKVKVDLGLEVAPDDEISQVVNAGGPQNVRRQIIHGFGGVKIGESDDLTQEIAQAYAASKKVPESQRLKYLYKLKEEINSHVEFRPGVVKEIGSREEGLLKKIAAKADKDMETLPGGDRLKEANAQFHKAAGLYDGLQQKLETPGMAEDSLAKLFRGDLSVISEGRNKDVTAMLDKIDEMAGKPVTQRLWKEMTVKNFKKNLGRGLGTFFTGQGGLGAAAGALFTGNPLAAGAALAASAPLVSPRVAAAGVRAGTKAAPYIERFLSTISNPKLQSAIISAIATPKERKK